MSKEGGVGINDVLFLIHLISRPDQLVAHMVGYILPTDDAAHLGKSVCQIRSGYIGELQHVRVICGSSANQICHFKPVQPAFIAMEPVERLLITNMKE